MKTINQVRAAFWAAHPEFKTDFRVKKRQNEYNATIRTAFCFYVDAIRKGGQITERLANRVTL